MRKSLLVLFLFTESFLVGKIQVVPTESAEPPRSGMLEITHPSQGQIFDKEPIQIEIELENFPLGVQTEDAKENLLYHSSDGQSIQVIVDNHEPFSYRGLSQNPRGSDSGDLLTYKFIIPFELGEGEHILRVFPVTSYGESIKDSSFFRTTFFYYKKRNPKQDIKLNRPFITFSEPFGVYELKKGQPLLLDFFVSNCKLAKDECKVLLRIDDEYQKKLFDPPPYLIYGLEGRSHKIELLLMGPDNEILPGDYNQVERRVELK